ncbi:MAG: TetR family transcriptional regulator [Bacteroidetes bacterium MedPE-SWsnd-G2]|nr:MAG: TetR family transcriptional regulator [Bacteroidetes bacterium MedPE-SWsnd-G2]
MKIESRKQEIITTAAKLFKEKGYSAVTMRDIAKVMGIKAASLYNHITSKQDILKDIIISLAETFTDKMAAIRNAELSNVEKLKQIIQLHVDITAGNTFGMAALNNDWMHLEDELNYYLELRSNYEKNFRAIIEEGIASEEFSQGNVEVMLFSMLSTLRSLYIWIPKKEDVSPQQLSKDLASVLINGINI